MPLDDLGNYTPALPDENFSKTPGSSPFASATQNGHGSPVGVKLPDFVGQPYSDLDGGYWTSIGLTVNDWMQVA